MITRVIAAIWSPTIGGAILQSDRFSGADEKLFELASKSQMYHAEVDQ